jgi:hypothetical protein
MSKLPAFTSLHGYRAPWLRGDVIAGLTVWADTATHPEDLWAALSGDRCR